MFSFARYCASSSSMGSCPVGVRGLHYFSSVVYHCQFHWTNREGIVKKVRDRMQHRHKRFLRFKAPVYYLDDENSWKQASNEHKTWVWVSGSHDYMLFFPHNFNVLSLGTMGIITDNFWISSGKGDIHGYCDRNCVRSKYGAPRCALTWKDIQILMAEVTTEQKTDWNYICLQLDYDVTDVISDPNSATPDLFYYWRFLRQLFIRRPFLGKGLTKDDFIHYHCYDRTDQLKGKELHMNYYVVVIIAISMWLYSPLLVYYLPSSERTTINYPPDLNSKDFIPTYKSPVYFGNLLRCVLCFYMEENKGIKSRVRRLIFIFCSFGVSFRFWYTPYSSILAFVIPAFLLGVSIPVFWSVYLGDRHPTHFLNLWKYPNGVFRKNTKKKEYQFLAHCMQERFYLLVDRRLLTMLVRESFKSPLFTSTWADPHTVRSLDPHQFILSVCTCGLTLVYVGVLLVVYHFVPAFYFYKQLFLALFNATRRTRLIHRFDLSSYCVLNALSTVASLAFAVVVVAYLMVVTMFCCYLIAEVTLFTYIGAVMEPSMAFRYVTLAGAISVVLYKISKNLTGKYDELRDEVVEILQKPDHMRKLCQDCGRPAVLQREEKPDGNFKIHLNIDSNPSKVVLYKGSFATFLSKPLLDHCIEECSPLRRQMIFIAVQVFVMTFYLSIAMWIKNVFHKEKDVSSIFTIAQTIAMYFIPGLFQFLAHKSGFRKKDNVFFKQNVHEAVVIYLKRQHGVRAGPV